MEGYERFDPDRLKEIREQQIGLQGMKIDRMFFEKFEERVKEDDFIKSNVDQGNWERVIEYVSTHIMDKPEEFFTLEKLRKAAGVDRRLTLREIIEKAYGFIQHFKSKDDLLEEEFEKFIADTKPERPDIIMALKYFFKAYITNNRVRDIIENKRLTELYTNPTFTMQDFKAVPAAWRTRISEYIKDYVPLNQFM
jgi:type I restriction enzyme R subunit